MPESLASPDPRYVGKPLFLPGDTILMYGDTGSGKTAQGGEAADHMDDATGKPTLLYTMDRGGFSVVQPYINLGIIEVESLLVGDPWVAINAMALGRRFVNGKWVDANLKASFSLIMSESLSSMAEGIMVDMAKANAQGKGIGGKTSFALSKGSGADSFQVSSNTQTDYAGVQTFLSEKVWQLQSLGLPLICTTHVKRGTDEDNSSVLGPVVAGRALTTVVPRWFKYTMRIDAIPAVPRPRHILFLEEHTDMGLKGFGNARVPLASTAPFKTSIEPASIIAAMKMIREGEQSAESLIRARKASRLPGGSTK